MPSLLQQAAVMVRLMPQMPVAWFSLREAEQLVDAVLNVAPRFVNPAPLPYNLLYGRLRSFHSHWLPRRSPWLCRWLIRPKRKRGEIRSRLNAE